MDTDQIRARVARVANPDNTLPFADENNLYEDVLRAIAKGAAAPAALAAEALKASELDIRRYYAE